MGLIGNDSESGEIVNDISDSFMAVPNIVLSGSSSTDDAVFVFWEALSNGPWYDNSNFVP